MSGRRSRVTVVVAATTLTLAAAVSAAAVTMSAGTAGPPTAGNAYLTMVNQHQNTVQAAQRDVTNEAQLVNRFYQARIAAGERMRRHEAAVAKAAAARRAAKRAAARRAAARRAAAARAAAARAAAAKAAAQAAAAKAAAEQAAARQQAATQAATQAPAAPAAPAAPSGSPQQIAAAMLGQFGWSSSQFSCLQPLWERESGWNVYAQNPSSGAYGIPQALPGSKMASAGADWQTDPATQIRWGLTYIQSTYGSPCGAWAHEQAAGWY